MNSPIRLILAKGPSRPYPFPEAYNSRTRGVHPGRILMIMLLGVIFWHLLIFAPIIVWAGPPFITDDPEPIEYRHWEVDLAGQFRHGRSGDSTTLPQFELDYGLAPDVQIHLLLPLVYLKPAGASSQYGYGDTELGVKFRFLSETDYRPQVAVFPLVELPTGDSGRGLGNGRTQYFLPVWLQKSLGPWTAYGGAGYWINPGDGNKDWWLAGWVIQRDLNKTLTLGLETYYRTADTEAGRNAAGYAAGAIINITENHHLLLSLGQDINGRDDLAGYIGYQFTFGPPKKDPSSLAVNRHHLTNPPSPAKP